MVDFCLVSQECILLIVRENLREYTFIQEEELKMQMKMNNFYWVSGLLVLYVWAR